MQRPNYPIGTLVATLESNGPFYVFGHTQKGFPRVARLFLDSDGKILPWDANTVYHKILIWYPTKQRYGLLRHPVIVCDVEPGEQWQEETLQDEARESGQSLYWYD